MDRIRIKDIAKLAELSVGTVDRVIHGRNGVSEASKKRVEEILKQLNYQPNMYASALASNKKYNFACLLPQHATGEYWTDVETGIKNAVNAFSDFNISVEIHYYDPFYYDSFTNTAKDLLTNNPDGVIVAPTVTQNTLPFIHELNRRRTPYIFIDSDIAEEPALAFFGQNSHSSGYFAARMLMLLAGEQTHEIVIFRKINEGIVGSNQQERREVGFREYMRTHHPDCLIWEMDLHAKQDGEDESMLNQFFSRHPNVKNGITFNSKVYIIGEYLQKHGLTDFNLMGYDLIKRNVECLRRGNVFFLIAQQPTLQGFNSIKTLCDHLILKKEVERVHFMPVDLLTKENIDFYYSK